MASTVSRHNAEIDRFLWHAASRLTTRNSNLSEPSSSAAANAVAVDSDGVLSPLKAAGDLPTQGRARPLRFVAPQHRLSPHRVQASHTNAVVVPPPSPLPRAARRLFRVTPPSSTTSRARAAAVSPRCSCVRARRCRQAGRPRDRAAAAQGARSQERCRVGAREDAAAAAAATQAVSSEQLNSLALCVVQLASRASRDFTVT